MVVVVVVAGAALIPVCPHHWACGNPPPPALCTRTYRTRQPTRCRRRSTSPLTEKTEVEEEDEDWTTTCGHGQCPRVPAHASIKRVRHVLRWPTAQDTGLRGDHPTAPPSPQALAAAVACCCARQRGRGGAGVLHVCGQRWERVRESERETYRDRDRQRQTEMG